VSIPTHGALRAISKKRISLTRHHARPSFPSAGSLRPRTMSEGERQATYHRSGCVAPPTRQRNPRSMNTLPALSAPLPTKSAAKPAKPLKVTGKNKVALDLMVWEGLKRSEAAEKAGLTDHSLYVALTKPHVKAYYIQQCEVLRTSGRARRIHRLEQMQEQDDNKAAVVNAILALERLGDSQVTGAAGQSATPGVIIQILTQAPVQQVQTIEDERPSIISTT